MKRLACMIAAVFALGGAEPALAEVRQLPVPVVTLYPGDALSAEVLTEKPFRMTESAKTAYAGDASYLAGKIARRTLVAGKPIALSAVKNREVIQRGKIAPAVFKSGGLTISTLVMPLQSGTAGDLIEARNLAGGRTIHAIASPDGTLIVTAAQ